MTRQSQKSHKNSFRVVINLMFVRMIVGGNMANKDFDKEKYTF